jgi:glutamate formiminotransferase
MRIPVYLYEESGLVVPIRQTWPMFVRENMRIKEDILVNTRPQTGLRPIKDTSHGGAIAIGARQFFGGVLMFIWHNLS